MKRHTPLSKLMKTTVYCDQQGLSMRQNRFWFDRQSINERHTCAVGNGGGRDNGWVPVAETHLHSWKWTMKIQLVCSRSRQEVSTDKGTCYFTPELCSDKPRVHSQTTTPQLLQSSFLYSLIFSFPILSSIKSNWVVCTSTSHVCFIYLCFTKWAVVYFDWHKWRWDGEILVCKNSSFFHSALSSCTFSSYLYIPLCCFALTV
jgi:hypothetical protein